MDGFLVFQEENGRPRKGFSPILQSKINDNNER